MSDSDFIDYYEILGASRSDDIKTIKKKYRKLAMEYHPDANPDATVEQKQLLEEKMKLINLAQSILTDEKRKEEYDKTYDNYKNGNYDKDSNNVNDVNTNEDFTYDDVKETYTKEEEYYAKAQALKQIIEEELEKVNIIIDEKNRLVSSAYYKIIDNQEYYESTKELLNVSIEFIDSLYTLIAEAKEYGLYGDVNAIEDTITFIQELLNDMPDNIIEAEFCVKKEMYKENIVHKIEDIKNNIESVIDKINSILLYVSKGMINKKEYYDIYINCINEARYVKSEAKQIMNICGILDLQEELKSVTELSSKISLKMDLLPSDYDKALKVSKLYKVNSNIEDALNKKDEIYKKISRIEKILAKHNSSRRYKQLYEYQESLYQKAIEMLESVKEEFKANSNIEKEKMDFINYINEAIELYKSSNEIHKNVDEIYANMELNNVVINEKEHIIPTLTKNTFSLIDKIKALESFIDAKEIMSIYEKIEELNNNSKNELYNNLLYNIKLLKDKKEEFIEKYQYVVEVYDNYTTTNSKTYKATKGKYSKGKIMRAIYNEIAKTKKKLAAEIAIIATSTVTSLFGFTNIITNMVSNQGLVNLPISLVLACLFGGLAFTLYGVSNKTKEYLDSLNIELYNVMQLKNTYNPTSQNDQYVI